MSRIELVSLVCCDLGAIVRGRSLPASELDSHLAAGVSWVPANHALTPLGPLAEPNPFGSIGDLRLLPDASTRACVEAGAGAGPLDSGPLDFVLCDVAETDGRPWECCPRHWLREALGELEREYGLRVMASFEHEFQLLGAPDGAATANTPAADAAPASAPTGHAPNASTSPASVPPAGVPPAGVPPAGVPPALPFSLEAQRRAEPFAADVMGALIEAGAQPERFFPEYASHQFEIPVRPAEGVAAADRSVVLKEVVREIARRHGLRACFTPLLDPTQAGNGAHIHLTLLDAYGEPELYDAARPGCLSEIGERFAAGILSHAPALTALTAPSPLSAMRLAPHHWSAGAVCLGLRNREALLRIPPLVSCAGGEEERQLRLEYRAADAAANPYLALGAIVRAGLHGLRGNLPAPPILDRDPAQLDPAAAARYGVGALPGSLADSLRALAEDEIARAWMTPLLYEAYLSVRRAELDATADWDLERMTARYAAVY